MASSIARITSIDGTFYAKAEDGNIREVSQGDTIYEGEVLLGDKNNGIVDSAIVTLDNGKDIILLGDNAQRFDASLFNAEFSTDETVSDMQTIKNMLSSNTEDDVINDDLFDEDASDGNIFDEIA